MNKTFKNALHDWQTQDIASYSLGVALGLFLDHGKSYPESLYNIFWTNNPTGNFLRDMLISMTNAGILFQNENLEYKWNDNPEYQWNKTYG